MYNLTCIQDNIYPKNIHCYIVWVLNSYFPPNLTDMCLVRARVQINLCPSHWWCIDICWYLDLGPSHRKYKCTLSHVDMSALLLKLQTEREKREALEHEVDIIKRRLEERSVVQSAADYKQTLFSQMLHVQLYLRTGTEATHRQHSEGCLLPHVPSFPCNSHRHPSCVITELLRGRSREQVTRVWQLAPPTASSSVLLTSQRQTMSTRSSSVKRCLRYLTRHQAWITCQNLPGSPCPPLFSAGSKVIRGIIARRGNSLRPPRALPCFSRPLNVKRCLPEAPASNDVYRYLTRHQTWITCQNLPSWVEIVGRDVEEAAGPLQVCAGQDGGCEAAVHAMRRIFHHPDTSCWWMPQMPLTRSTGKLPFKT